MNLLSQIDIKQIEKVISYSQNIENPKINTLMQTWERAKYTIAHKMLNDKVIYTYPEKVRFELSDETKDERYYHFMDYIYNLLGDTTLYNFLGCLSSNEFYNNTLSRDYIIREKDDKKILKGSKIIKAFKYFIDNEILLHDLQSKASELIQENKVEGYLSFSIHPLDFLSSSENTYNWRSCHALDGEFRAGNLSYICDSSTMIVYLASEKEERLPHFPDDVLWNSKKWRMLLHFSEDLNLCFASRQYPFFSPGALEKVKEVFNQNIAPMYYGWLGVKRTNWLGWYDDYIENYCRPGQEESEEIMETRYFVANGGIYDRYAVMKNADDSRHFNDVLSSSCYTKPFYMFTKHIPRDLKIEVGAPVLCLHCGEQIINGGDSMMCSDCECKYGNSESDEYRVCECCGTRFYYNEGGWVGDEFLCASCYEQQSFTCQDCGERRYNTEKHWDDEFKCYVCQDCYNERNDD